MSVAVKILDSDAGSVFNRNQQMGVVHDQRQNQLKIKEESNPIPILPQPAPPTTTLIITTPLNTVQSSSNDPVSRSFCLVVFLILTQLLHYYHCFHFELGLSYVVIYWCFLAQIVLISVSQCFVYYKKAEVFASYRLI